MRPDSRLLRQRRRKRTNRVDEILRHLVVTQRSRKRRLVDDDPRRVAMRKKHCRHNQSGLLPIIARAYNS